MRSAFTIIELMVTLAICMALIGLGFAAYSRAMETAARVTCLGKMRKLAAGFLLYTQDNGGNFPVSMHSSFARRQQTWTTTVTPYLDQSQPKSAADAQAFMNTKYHCPEDAAVGTGLWSYGLNVYFELLPLWYRIANIPSPSRTVLLGELAGEAGSENLDHFMANTWQSIASARTAIGYLKHGGVSNYAFVDGHVETLPVEGTFDPSRGLDRWNPETAGKP